jgi:hypothetical protein
MSIIISPSDVSDLIIPNVKSRKLTKNTIPTEIAKSLETLLKKLIDDYGLTNENIIFIVTNMMSAVGKYKTLTGIEKKEVVIILVNKAIDESDDLDKQVKVILKMTMGTVIPTAIDIMIDISKNKYQFKHISLLAAWCKKLKCCL